MAISRRSSREPSVPRAIKSHTLRAVGRAKSPPPKKKPTYKIVFEEVTAPKKKVKWNEACGQAPRGYTFVPYGNPELTNHCRQACLRRNIVVYVVKAQSRTNAATDPNKVSTYTHRVGHHYPTRVVDDACVELNLVLKNGLWVSRASNRLAPGQSGYLQSDDNESKRETEQEVTAAILEIYPFIPKEDLLSIWKHAFAHGTNRVGTASDVLLSRRVQLAVTAHIRHNYTNYDKLLKETTWTNARNAVEGQSIAVILKWRGEDSPNNETEQILQEYIVVNDDEDDEDDQDTTDSDETSEELQLVATPRPARELEDDDLDDVRWMQNPGRLERNEGKTFLLRPIYDQYKDTYFRSKATQAALAYHDPARHNVASGYVDRPAGIVGDNFHQLIRRRDQASVVRAEENHRLEMREVFNDRTATTARHQPVLVPYESHEQRYYQPPLQHYGVRGVQEHAYLQPDEAPSPRRQRRLPHDGMLGVGAHTYAPSAGASEPKHVVDSHGTMYKLHPIDEAEDTNERYRSPVVPLPPSNRQYDRHQAGRRNLRPVPEEDQALPSVERDVIDLTNSPSPPRRIRARRF